MKLSPITQFLMFITVQADKRSHATWEAQRPPSFETAAVRALFEALRADKAPPSPGFVLHIAHVSSAEVLPLVAAAKAEGAPPSLAVLQSSLPGMPSTV